MSIPYSKKPIGSTKVEAVNVFRFANEGEHEHARTIRAFGEEWKRFSWLSDRDIKQIAKEYFDLLPKGNIDPASQVLDAGCGNGRWTRYLAPHVRHIEAIDPSEAILAAAKQNKDLANVRWSQASLDDVPFADGSFDLVICLGVIHHVPSPAEALKKLVRKIRPGGRLLLYIYYTLEHRSTTFRILYRLADVLRRVISKLPSLVKFGVCDLIAAFVYFPLVLMVRTARSIGWGSWQRLPLSLYYDKSFRVMRIDALDRFGTPLEQRFGKDQITAMVHAAGLEHITFAEQAPYWHLIGTRPMT